MLTSIKLGNFKAFGPTQTIPIKPITLIFGPNSAGKSSIIHSLLLAHQAAVVDGNLDVRCPKIAGNSVDLGGFEDYVHRHVITQPVRWQAEFVTGKLQGRLAEFLKQSFKTLEVALEFGVRTVEAKEMKRRLNPKTGLDERIPVPTGVYVREGKPFVKRYEIRLDGKTLIGLEARHPGVLAITLFDVRNPTVNRNLRASFTGDSAVPGLEKVTDEELEQAAREMLDTMSARADQLVPECVGKRGMEQMEAHVYHAPAEVLFYGTAYTNPRLVRSVCVQFLELVNGLLEASYTAVNGALASMHYLGPLRTVPPRNFNHYEAHDPNWFSGGAYAWQVARENPEVLKKVNEWLSGKGRLTPGYTLELLRYFAPQSLREPLTDAADDLTFWVRQQVRRHRGGGGLAVRAGDRDAVLEPHQLGQHLGAGDDRDLAAARLHDLRVVLADRRRDDHHVDVGHVLGGVALLHHAAQAGQQRIELRVAAAESEHRSAQDYRAHQRSAFDVFDYIGFTECFEQFTSRPD